MMKFLRNPAWLSVLVSALAIVVSVTFYINSRPVKKLRVEILSNSPVVSIDNAMPKELEILYKGVPVRTLSIILLRITNTGTEPIKESDYSEPIRVTMSERASIGEVAVQQTRPDAIELTPTASASNQVALAKVLLNPGDQAIVRILALNNDSTLKVTARIVGISALDIQSALESNNTKRVVPFGALLGALFAVAIVIAAAFIWQSRSVMEWRRKRFGFDPARYYYTLAQSGVLTLPASKDPEKASAALSQIVANLDKAFDWDITYMERAKSDPLFTQLVGYEKFKDVTAKHRAPS